jgi:Ca-activated chloride channel family protein
MRALLPILLILPAALGAQGLIIPRCPRPMPGSELECRPAGQQIIRTRSDVKVELRDRVLRYEVEERFVNRGGTVGEADYVFPLPKNAAFRDLKLSIDGELVAGETMNATDARRIYEEIVRSQRDPALVEWMGHGMLRTRIFPIQPGEERRVVVRYESVADREGDAVRIDYFRGSNPDRGVQQQGGGAWEGSNRRMTDAARTSFALTYRAGGELGEAYSPTHELDVERDGVRRDARIRGGGPDITVLVALRRSRDASISMLPHAVRGEPGYALITVTPPADVAGNRLPRDITFVIDVSGSMAGKKMEQAKAAGHQLLGTLSAQDRFRVIDFSTDVRSFRDDFVPATDANVRAARRYIDDLDATGSTNISGALEQALRSGSNCGSLAEARDDCAARVPIVLFMTDGAPTVGDRDPGSIAAKAARMRRGARVFTFGVGADLNVGLIEQLALEGRGTAHFVRPDESVERSVELVASRLRQPLLTDVRVEVAGSNVRLSRLYPGGEQDIFAGQDLVLLARYDGSGSANVVVRGRSGGRDVQWSTLRNFPRDERDNAFVPRLWATQRIGWLSAEKRKNGGSTEIDGEIRQLGERFGIPTEFTSYLVLEPGMVAGAQTQRGRLQDMRGAPVTSGGVRGSVGSGASSVAPPGAPAPAVAQFEQAREASQQRAARSLAAADVAMESRPDAARRAGNRVFTRDGERWIDSRFKPELRVYKVKAYSQGYFALLEKLPELRESLAIGDKVVVAGRAVAVEIVEDAPDLGAGDIEAIARAWQ